MSAKGKKSRRPTRASRRATRAVFAAINRKPRRPSPS